MKIGMLTGLWYIAESATLVESLHRAALLGFRYVDLHGVFHAGPVHLPADERQKVKAAFSELGLIPRNYVLHVLHNLASASQGELDHDFEYLKEGIDMALGWGIHQLMLNAGQWAYGVPRPLAWEKAVRFIQQVCDYAAPRGMFIAQEAEPYVWFLVHDIPSTTRMLEDVGRENFTVLVDLGHMGLCRESPQDLAVLGDVIIHAHFSDHEKYRHTNQIIGTGVTPTADYLRMLFEMDIDRRINRYGYEELVVSFELGVPGDHIPEPDDWVRESLRTIQMIAPNLSLV